MLLIIGKESLIGSAISQIADEKHISWVGTSRRPGEQWFVDLSMQPASWQIPPQATTAIICAARTKLADCETNPDESRAINVTATVELARRLTAQGCRVVFLSTNQVFSPNLSTPPDESAPVSPANEYGRQKAEAEAAILALSPKNIVIRLTKILNINTPIIQKWLYELSNNRKINAFSNLYFAPIYLDFAISDIIRICQESRSGIFHVSPTDSISYNYFAKWLVIKKGCDLSLINAIDCSYPNSPYSCRLNTFKMLSVNGKSSIKMLENIF